MKKGTIQVVLIVIVLLASAAAGYYLYSNSRVLKDVVENGTNSKISEKEITCQDGWKKFRQETIGVEFCYDETWGTPVNEPFPNITRLDGVVDEFGEGNLYHNSIYVEFSGNSDYSGNLKLHFFNDQYRGEYYPHSTAYDKGYFVDNISQLKQSGNICDYKIEFDGRPAYDGIMKEVNTTCDAGLKTSLINRETYYSHINKTLNNYALRSFGYTKLKNGYFDNLLVKYFHDAEQSEDSVISISKYLQREGISSEKFSREKENLQKLINSIQALTPPRKEISKFEAVEGEDEDITIIRKYYWLIETRDFDSAYGLISGDSKISLGDFKNQYGNINSIKPRDFVKKDNQTYEFYLDKEEYNNPKEKYRTIAKVENGKVQITFSEKYLTEEVSFDNYKIYASQRGNKNYVFLIKDGKEIIIDQGDASYDGEYSNIQTVKFFSDAKFSPKGNYFTYSMGGWEWVEGYVYDIKSGKIILEMPSSTDYEFTPDENYFYACTSNQLSGDSYGYVYAAGEFNRIYDAYAGNEVLEYMNVDCYLGNDNKSVIFKFSCHVEEGECPSESGRKTVVEYLLDEKRATVN